MDEPRRVWPSYWPAGSAAMTLKNWIRNRELGCEAYCPWIAVVLVVTSGVAVVSDGGAIASLLPPLREIPIRLLEKIELDRIASPIDRTAPPLPASTFTPAELLNAIVLPWLELAPPIVLPDDPVMITPSTSLPSRNSPVRSVPIRLPSTALAVAVAPSIWIPQCLAETGFLVAPEGPPMVLAGAPPITAPCWGLGSTGMPDWSVPIMLPTPRSPAAVAPSISMPALLPEMPASRFPLPSVVWWP